MKKLSHQEILEGKPSIEEVKEMQRSNIVVLLENVRSLFNVGAIFRSADGILVEKIILCGITGTPPRKEISKTALGAEEIVPWEYKEDSIEAVKELKEQGYEIVAVELSKGSEHYKKKKYQQKTCIILGHEVEGISDELMEEVDSGIFVPMKGRANSLNVATCFGITSYEIAYQLGII